MQIMINVLIRKAWGLFYFYGGIFHLVRFINNVTNKRLTIVTYHRITDKDISQIELSLPYLFTSQEIFEKHLQFYKEWYNVTTFEDLHNYVGRRNVPWNSLIITFDDGYADNYHNAYPTLKKMNLPATFFIPVGKIGNNCSEPPFWWDKAYYYFKKLHGLDKETLLRKLGHEVFALFDEFQKDPSNLFSQLNKEDDMKIEKLLAVLEDQLKIDNDILAEANSTMTWEQISAMGKDMHFGSHSCSHDNILTMEQTRKVYEIKESKNIIEEKTKQNVGVFSYPCGNTEENVRTLVKDAGYEFAVTTDKGVNDLSDCYALKRINIWEGSSLSEKGRFFKGYFAYEIAGF